MCARALGNTGAFKVATQGISMQGMVWLVSMYVLIVLLTSRP